MLGLQNGPLIYIILGNFWNILNLRKEVFGMSLYPIEGFWFSDVFCLIPDLLLNLSYTCFTTHEWTPIIGSSSFIPEPTDQSRISRVCTSWWSRRWFKRGPTECQQRRTGVMHRISSHIPCWGTVGQIFILTKVSQSTSTHKRHYLPQLLGPPACRQLVHVSRSS